MARVLVLSYQCRDLQSWWSATMKAIETLAIYLTPFLVLGMAAKLWPKQCDVDLTDVHSQAGPNRRPRKVFLLGSWLTEK
jgi:hypothetical protein